MIFSFSLFTIHCLLVFLGNFAGYRVLAVLVFDDFGNSLHGATPETVADEVMARRAQWDLVAAAPKLSTLPILNISATHALGPVNHQLDEALRRAGNSRVTEIQVDTDHSFSDHRKALAAA